MDTKEFQAIHDEICRKIYERQQPSFKRNTAYTTHASTAENCPLCASPSSSKTQESAPEAS